MNNVKRLLGFDMENTPSRCTSSIYWTGSALEYSGAKNLRVDHPECIFKGGSRCYFVYTWE
jgi:hypothetical protein